MRRTYASTRRKLDKIEKQLKSVIEKRKANMMANATITKRITWTCSRCRTEQVVEPQPCDREDRLPVKWQWISGHDSSEHWLLCDQCVEAHQEFMAAEKGVSK